MDVVLPLPGATASAASRSYSRHVRRRIVVKDCQSAEDVQEIRVCTNRTCRRQGSMQILETLTDLAPPNVSVKSSGCLGRCGAGPNLVALPAATLVAHCGTTARAAEVLVALVLPRGREGDGGGGSNWDAIVNKSLEALALRNKARSEVVDKNNFSQAELFLSQAIELGPIGGVHIMYKQWRIYRGTWEVLGPFGDPKSLLENFRGTPRTQGLSCCAGCRLQLQVAVKKKTMREEERK